MVAVLLTVRMVFEMKGMLWRDLPLDNAWRGRLTMIRLNLQKCTMNEQFEAEKKREKGDLQMCSDLESD